MFWSLLLSSRTTTWTESPEELGTERAIRRRQPSVLGYQPLHPSLVHDHHLLWCHLVKRERILPK